MAWLIGIICIIFVVSYWRIFVPLALLVAVGFGLFFFIGNYKSIKKSEKNKKTVYELKKKESSRWFVLPSEKHEWQIEYQRDPASGKNVARDAYVFSNGGLCCLSVEQRIDGTRLTAIYCQDIEISEWRGIQVKFDGLSTSDKMCINRFCNSNGVYISSYQSSGYLDYDLFISLLKTSNAVAIKMPVDDGIWITFNLKGSSAAIDKLGKVE